jgi:hypothetical protein
MVECTRIGGMRWEISVDFVSVDPNFRDMIFSLLSIRPDPFTGRSSPKNAKTREPINSASGPSKPYEVWRLELSAHAHVPHSRLIAGQQRNAIEATFIENNLYEATQRVKLFFGANKRQNGTVLTSGVFYAQ